MAAGDDLTGQGAVVTGGSKGIGLAIGRALAEAGARVVLVARDPTALDRAVESVRHDVGTDQVFGLTCDVTRLDAICRMFESLAGLLPRLNVFVANAGTGSYIPFLDTGPDQWDDIVALNLTGAFHCAQRAARLMLDHDGNRAILFVSSIRAGGARPGVAAYAATKAAVNQLARVAAYELAPHGIRVNVLSPGMTVTPLVLEHTPEVHDKARAQVPMGRPGSPDDMAAAAVYLCSPAARFVTGANLVVDGGEALW